MNHSSTPWHVVPFVGNDRLVANEQDVIAQTYGDPKEKANAAHIVKCVNAHDELVAALRELTELDVSDARALAKALHTNGHRVTGTEAERISFLLNTFERAHRVARRALTEAGALRSVETGDADRAALAKVQS